MSLCMLAMLVMIVWSFALDQAIKTMENQQERTLGDLFDKNIDKLLSDENFRKRIEQKIKQVHYGLEGIWWQTGVYVSADATKLVPINFLLINHDVGSCDVKFSLV